MAAGGNRVEEEDSLLIDKLYMVVILVGFDDFKDRVTIDSVSLPPLIPLPQN